MAAAWGEWPAPLAEQYFDDYPQLYDHPEAAVRVIYEEVCLRQDHGVGAGARRVPGARFPQWRARGWRSSSTATTSCNSRATPDRSFRDVGEQLGDLRLLRELGRGRPGPSHTGDASPSSPTAPWF